MGYALRRSRLLVWSWQLCRGMSGNFRVEPVAILPWNQWQFLHGISGNFQMESVATFAWNTQPLKVWVLCLYFMGLNVSNEQIAHELSINESDAYQMTTELRGGIVKKASRDPL